MKRAFITGSALALPFVALAAADPPQTPDDYLAAVAAVGEPPFDPARKSEPGYLDSYRAAQHQLYQKKAAILLDLCRAYPHDERVPEWIDRRWVLLGWNQPPAAVAAEVLADIEAVATTDLPPAARIHAEYWRTYFMLHDDRFQKPDPAAAAVRFADAHPADGRTPALLALAAELSEADAALQRRLYQRLARDYPDTHYGKYAPGMLRRLDSLGKPFELTFGDELTGREIDLKGLRGKVVLLDFWATTCPPCVAEMPKLKELYAKYAPRGVEFVGISLDEPETDGGRAALREFLKRHVIPWPQFYQGRGYDSDFSKSWGVGSAPAIFILDRQGHLRSTDAHKDPESWIQRLLAD